MSTLLFVAGIENLRLVFVYQRIVSAARGLSLVNFDQDHGDPFVEANK